MTLPADPATDDRDAADPAQHLMRAPLYLASDLGAALPASPHAVSVALPTWASCVGYEEKAPWVLNALRAGYPRFVTHPLLGQLLDQLAAQLAIGRESLVIAPSLRAGQRIAEHLQLRGHLRPAIHDLGRAQLHYLIIDPAMAPTVRECSQHAGLLPSSRQCAAALQTHPVASPACDYGLQLRELLGSWYGVAADAVHLAANGMGSIAAVHRALGQRSPGARTLQLGFPYVDLLKVQRSFGSGVHFIPGHDESALQQAEQLLSSEPIAAVFLEVPGNPLLRTPDVPRLAAACRRAGVPLVIDDTVASPLNVELLPYADVVVDSLTKYVAGNGTVMGGAAVVSPHGPWATDLSAAIAEENDGACWWQDLQVLATAAAGYPQRIQCINQNSHQLVQRLRQHPAVAAVLFPDECPHYRQLQRPGAGFAGLCSLLLKDPERNAPLVYDAMAISKGPSLGTVFSLCCPFTLLAHYKELDWAESLGVSRWLLRLSIGCEDIDLTWSRLEPALDLALR